MRIVGIFVILLLSLVLGCSRQPVHEPAIRKEFPAARIVVLTTFEGDVEIQRALEAGARAYMLKSLPPKELVEAIRQVQAGKKRIPAQIAAQLASI